MHFKVWLESTVNDLYASAVNAFPRTTKRQHSTQPIKIVEMRWIPYTGFKTLFIKGRAKNEGREYNPIIIFKDVKYGSGMSIIASDEKEYLLERLSSRDNDVLLKCNCKDFYYRFHHYNHIDNSLYGRDRKKYEAKTNRPPANPTESPGMCKHLMVLISALRDSGLLS